MHPPSHLFTLERPSLIHSDANFHKRNVQFLTRVHSIDGPSLGW
jgi:hypothetical protein